MNDHNQANTLPDIVQTLSLRAPIAKVWNAVATAEGISAWFMPNNFEAILGHEFQLEAGPFGNSPCKVIELDPPHKLSFSWGQSWTLTFELVEKEAGTELTLTHGGWHVDQVTEFGELHTIVRERMAGGWSGIVKKLASYVEQ